MSDDMGWSNLGCFGGEIETPRLDALPENGLRFTQFYSGARSCPSRSSPLAGPYAHQGGMAFDSGFDGYRGELGPKTPTIAEVLRESGYRTCMVGKWHQTHNAGPYAATPLDGLTVGWDGGDPVGEYSGEFRFSGKIGSVVIETEKGNDP